jgi:hypothetical protein
MHVFVGLRVEILLQWGWFLTLFIFLVAAASVGIIFSLTWDPLELVGWILGKTLFILFFYFYFVWMVKLCLGLNNAVGHPFWL